MDEAHEGQPVFFKPDDSGVAPVTVEHLPVLPVPGTRIAEPQDGRTDALARRLNEIFCNSLTPPLGYTPIVKVTETGKGCEVRLVANPYWDADHCTAMKNLFAGIVYGAARLALAGVSLEQKRGREHEVYGCELETNRPAPLLVFTSLNALEFVLDTVEGKTPARQEARSR